MKTLILIFALQSIFFVNEIQAQFTPPSAPPVRSKSSQPVCSILSRERPDVPDFLTCEGISYCFKDQSYNGICGRVFCQAKSCDNSQECKDDNEPKTVACYNKMIAASNAKAKFSTGAEIPAGTSK